MFNSPPEATAETLSPRPWRRYLPLVLVAAIAAAIALSGISRYLSLDALSHDRVMLLGFVHEHPTLSLELYILAYFCVVAFSIPGALIMTLAGGFLFGVAEGTFGVAVGVTAGAFAMYAVARSAWGGALRRLVSASTLARLERAAHSHAFSTFLTLRLMPGVPIWMVNIGAGVLRIHPLSYLFSTALGVLPSTLLYASVGSGLGRLFERGKRPNLGMMLEPQWIAMLVGLSALALLPVAVNLWRQGRRVEA
jgi:uncharacterized membrane protein YdjX (TVP38/TMEM64 family)